MESDIVAVGHKITCFYSRRIGRIIVTIVIVVINSIIFSCIMNSELRKIVPTTCIVIHNQEKIVCTVVFKRRLSSLNVAVIVWSAVNAAKVYVPFVSVTSVPSTYTCSIA